MITPSRWMTKSSRGISDDWVDDMLNCNHFVKIHDYTDATNCFTGVEIKGGVSYWLYQQSFIGDCMFNLHKNDSVITHQGRLNASGTGIVIRDPNALAIISKVVQVDGTYYNDRSFSCLVGPRAYFTDIDKNILTAGWQGYVKKQDKNHPIKYYLNKRLEPSGVAWISLSDIPKGHESIQLHKVLIPKAGGTGNDPVVLGSPFYAEPNSCCSDTYLCIGYNPKQQFSKNECDSIISYIKTRFFRYMVSIKKKTQNSTRDSYQFVPLQDWSKPWTDAELYKKYNLSKEEIEYIESMIKPMGEEVLFNTDELINPEFANFNLLEHGVSVGDKIIYTPTGTELIVAKDNKVECDGELYTLAEFTAKYMPHNKRSVSGLCQGPKYFSFNGISLYKLKESFLKKS